MGRGWGCGLSDTIIVCQDGYKSRDGEKATFYIATPCGGADTIPQKLVIGMLTATAITKLVTGIRSILLVNICLCILCIVSCACMFPSCFNHGVIGN